MWPTLVAIGPLSLYSFGLVLFLGLFFGGFKLWQKAKEEGWEESAVMDGWLLAGVGALMSGRAGYVLLHLNQFGGSWYKMIFFTKFPGLSGEAAWLGGMGVLLLWGLSRKLDWWRWLEAVVWAGLIVEIFGRAAGAQFIWSLGLILIYGLIKFWEKRYRAFNFKEGVLAAAYLFLSGGLNLGLTGYEAQKWSWWGLALLLAGGLLLLFRSGITMKARFPKQTLRKKRGFDYA